MTADQKIRIILTSLSTGLLVILFAYLKAKLASRRSQQRRRSGQSPGDGFRASWSGRYQAAKKRLSRRGVGTGTGYESSRDSR